MKTLLLAFGIIFLAELGDKTQLALLAMRSKGLSGWGLFVGAIIAIPTLSSAILFSIPFNITRLAFITMFFLSFYTLKFKPV